MPQPASHTILHEMLRSFVALAHTLNLSKAVRQLKSTRQTVRRHISALEEAKGQPLFELVDRQYQLTKVGRRSLREAEHILSRSDAWLANRRVHIDGLEVIKHKNDTGQGYFSQQHHLSRIWQDGTPLLRTGFECWARSHGKIEDPALAEIRPYMLIYRRVEDHVWQCVEIGEKSSYAIWFGWKWVKSNVGYLVKDTPAGPEFAGHVSDAYSEINAKGGARLDHIFRTVPSKTGDFKSISFQRLLVGCSFPDGSPAIGSIAEFTRKVEIEDLLDEDFAPMTREMEKSFNPK